MPVELMRGRGGQFVLNPTYIPTHIFTPNKIALTLGFWSNELCGIIDFSRLL